MSAIGKSFTQALNEIGSERRGPRCDIEKILSKMTADDRADLGAAFDDPDIPAARIHRALLSLGIEVGTTAVQRHKRRHKGTGCKCPRTLTS